MVEKNDTFLREVNDELRNEQMRKLWDRYGVYLIGGVVAFIASIGIYQQVKSSRIAEAQAVGAKYEAARRLAGENKATDAASAFADIAKTGPAGFATLARLQQAGASAKAEKTAEAVALYDGVVADDSAEALLRDVARLQAAALRLDAADWTEMQNRLNSLVNERNAFRINARELLGLAARKSGKTDEARKLFLQVLGDAKATQPIKDRVSGYMSAIIAADITKAASPAAQPPATTPDPTKK